MSSPMCRSAFLFTLLLCAVAPVRGQYVAPEIFVEVDTVSVGVVFSATGDAAQCFPFESTIKTKIELALQRAGLTVVEQAPWKVYLHGTAIYPGLCAVSHEIAVNVWLHRVGIKTYLVGLASNGIFSRSTYADSKEQVRQLADDGVDMVVNEILKARRNQ